MPGGFKTDDLACITAMLKGAPEMQKLQTLASGLRIPRPTSTSQNDQLGKISLTQLDSIAEPAAGGQKDGFSVEERLDSIEASLADIKSILQTLSPAFRHASNPTGLDQPSESVVNDLQIVERLPGSTDSPTRNRQEVEAKTQSHFLKTIEPDLEKIKKAIPHQEGSTSLADLKSNSPARKRILLHSSRSGGSANAGEYVDTQKVDFRLLKTSVFEEDMSRGAPIFASPPREILEDLVFRPSIIQERGWVVMFNCVVSTRYLLERPGDSNSNMQLRWNLWQALSDADLFLEPSRVSVQAFLLLAAHGQDFSTPTSSWSLIGHAHRMMQALLAREHEKTACEVGFSEPDLQKLWFAVSVMEQSLSLAFGRAPSVPLAKVSLDDQQKFSSYRPHLTEKEALHGGQIGRPIDSFGQFHVLEFLKLAEFAARVSDGLYRPEQSINLDKLSTDLNTAKTSAFDSLADFSASSESLVDMHIKREIALGITNIQFRYSHLTLLVAQLSHDPTSCLEAARCCIRLLKYLVSDSRNVYNGVIWELLYYPFAAFFALFGSIVSSPSSFATNSDIELLDESVCFYKKMTQSHPQATKLRKVAATFTSLAKDYTTFAVQGSSDASAQVSDEAFPNFREAASGNFSNNLNILNFYNQDSFPADLPAGEQYISYQHENETSVMQILEQKTRKRPWDNAFDWLSWDAHEEPFNH
ncbi:MAG: hypothetical protein Q9227_002410 [Pyrenula ochraceoflavens]